MDDLIRTSPQPLHEFKRVEPTEIHLPELAKNRKRTDFPFLISFAVVVLIWIIWALSYLFIADINVLLNGRGSDGNICGYDNIHNEYNKIGKAKDYTNYPVLHWKKKNATGSDIKTKYIYECITEATCLALSKQVVLRRCLSRRKKSKIHVHWGPPYYYDDDPDSLVYFYKNKNNDLRRTSQKISYAGHISFTIRYSFDIFKIEPALKEPLIYELFGGASSGLLAIFIMIIFTSAVSLLIYICLRYSAGSTFIVLLALTIASVVAFTTVAWIILFTASLYWNVFLWFIPILASLFFLVIIFVVIFLYNQFKVTCRMVQEAVDFILESPVILILPLLTSVLIVGIMAFIIYIIVLSSAPLFLFDKTDSTNNTNVITSGSGWLGFLSFCMLWWMYFFITGYYYMIISGTVVALYFTRDKSMLRYPVITSVITTTWYHLGTLAEGSLLIPIITCIRIILANSRFICAFLHCGNAAMWMCDELQLYLHYISKKAYVMTALHGESLLPCGERAARLTWKFLLDRVAIDILRFTLAESPIFLMVVAGGTIGFSIVQGLWDETATLYLIVGILLSAVLADLYMSILTVTVETLLLCFCEDKLLNDGSVSRPYFMSERLAQLIDSAFNS